MQKTIERMIPAHAVLFVLYVALVALAMWLVEKDEQGRLL